MGVDSRQPSSSLYKKIGGELPIFKCAFEKTLRFHSELNPMDLLVSPEEGRRFHAVASKPCSIWSAVSVLIKLFSWHNSKTTER